MLTRSEKISASRRKKYNLKWFIERCKEVHGNIYDYSLVTFTETRDKITIICKNHGKFLQKGNNHLNGHGCPECAKEYKRSLYIISLKQFIKNARKIHGNLYDYSEAIYKGNKIKLKIICRKHGAFYQKPNNHLSLKSRCPKCHGCISEKEIQWLDSIGIPEEYRQYRIKNFKVDGFDPTTKTIYEFYGDYWHGNPKIYNSEDKNIFNGKKFGELYRRTYEREQKLKLLGYTVISIWECDFNKTNRLRLKS